MGLVGLGVGASQLLPALSSGTHSRLVAIADVRAEARERAAAELGVTVFDSVEALCDSEVVEAVWVATPNQWHARHAIAALERGKHVIVSKPLAITLEEADAMVEAAERNGRQLLAGHSQSMAPTIRTMAQLVRSGELGKLGMVHTWHYTDWLYRPRLPAELDVRQGGGPVFRQASHQVDIVRSIVGQPVRSVRAMTVDLDPARGIAGAYTVYLDFEDATPASIVYSGYGHLDLAAWLRGAEPATPRRGQPDQDEAARKDALRYGSGGSRGANTLGLFGLTVVSCERADLLEARDGVQVCRAEGRELLEVADEVRGTAELAELQTAVRGGTRVVHDGRWGRATLAVCLAIHASAERRADISP